MSHTAPEQISVVVTAYNCARYLGQALDSVLGQTLPPNQVIVVDDGSTDACAQVVAAYAGQVEYHRQDQGGAAAARNTGARLARGEWLAYLDGDDYWETGKLECQWSAVAGNPGLEAVFGSVEQFASPDLTAAERAGLEIPAGLQPGYYASTLLIRHAAFRRVGDFDTRLLISEFIDWYGRAIEAGLRSRLLPDRLAWRRVHADNSTRRNRLYRAEYARVLKAMLDRRRASPPGEVPS